MPNGYAEFEFDLQAALLEQLVTIFDTVAPIPLSAESVANIPDRQGVYQLFLDSGSESELVYIGKTDSDAGLNKRLARHVQKIQHRVGLDPKAVKFKAVRLFVFTPMDLETELKRHYGKAKKIRWDDSGFGSNDPGKERDTTNYKLDHFDMQYPIDIKLPILFPLPEMPASAADILRSLKTNLPYLIRFERPKRGSKEAHDDLENTSVFLPLCLAPTPEAIIAEIVRHLPTGWHATMLPSHIILYKDDNRKFPSGHQIAVSG